MADKENRVDNIDVEIEVEQDKQEDNNVSSDYTTDELKQQASELFKAAGGLAGSFGKLAKQKGSEIKEKIGDEEFQAKAMENMKALKEKATEQASRAAEKATSLAENTSKTIGEKTKTIKEERSAANTTTGQTEPAQKVAASGVGVENNRGRKKNSKTLGLILLIAGLVIIGLVAVNLGGQAEQSATEEPVAEESTETATDETFETEEESAATEETESAVYYSSNTSDTVRDGNKGVYSYKSQGGSYDVYYVIDFDEGYVYSFTDGDGSEEGDRVKIDSGNLNDVLMVTYDFDGDAAQYGFHFKYKNNPEHLVVQDNDGFETDYQPTDLKEALALKEGKDIKDY